MPKLSVESAEGVRHGMLRESGEEMLKLGAEDAASGEQQGMVMTMLQRCIYMTVCSVVISVLCDRVWVRVVAALHGPGAFKFFR